MPLSNNSAAELRQQAEARRWATNGRRRKGQHQYGETDRQRRARLTRQAMERTTASGVGSAVVEATTFS